MERFYAYFKPDNFYPVPVGTILRYAGHHYNHDTLQYAVAMDVIGAPVKQDIYPEVVFVDISKSEVNLKQYEKETSTQSA